LKRLAPAAAILLVAIGISFTPALRAKFTNWDDPFYVGAARMPLRILLTEPITGHWHPLTMLSLGADVRLFGLSPIALHAMNVALHAATALLVLLLLFELTGSVQGALAGALFFAIHPLRVESVAWVSERKDVLMGLFFAAAMLTYVAHLRRGASIGWTYLLFVMAILAKATAIVLPFGLLLIDVVELGRPRIANKIGFVALSAAGAVEAMLVLHSRAGNLSHFHYTVFERVALGGKALAMYLSREIVPVNLSAYYHYRETVDVSDWLSFAAVLLLGIALIALWRRYPKIVSAFAFFVLAMVPMLPIAETGNTIGADRYTYIPSIGLSYIVAVLVALVSMRAAIAILVAGSAILGALTWRRCEVWHDAKTLWTSVVEYDPEIAVAWNNLGHEQMSDGDRRTAFLCFSRAIELDPCYLLARKNRALELELIKQYDVELRDIDQLIACDPTNGAWWSMKGDVLKMMGRAADAEKCFARARLLGSRK
jgi:tetratricopeptide (TPR) repeat protein